MRKRDRMKNLMYSKRVRRIAFCALMLPLYAAPAQAVDIHDIEPVTKTGKLIKEYLAIAGTPQFVCAVAVGAASVALSPVGGPITGLAAGALLMKCVGS